MATIKPNKTNNAFEVLEHALSTNPSTIVGDTIDVSTKRAINIFMYYGPIEIAGAADSKFQVQVRPDDGAGSENEHWITVAEYVIGDNAVTEALTNTEAAGVKVLRVASTTNFIAGDLVYIRDTTTLKDSEWGQVEQIDPAVSIDIIDGLKTGKDSSDDIFDNAKKFVCALDLHGIESFRVLWLNEGASQADAHIKAESITYDSDDST